MFVTPWGFFILKKSLYPGSYKRSIFSKSMGPPQRACGPLHVKSHPAPFYPPAFFSSTVFISKNLLCVFFLYLVPSLSPTPSPGSTEAP